jgi:hypothetical protein
VHPSEDPRGRWTWTAGLLLVASPSGAITVAAQAATPDVCSLASSKEFQEAHGLNPVVGLTPDTPVKTEMVWGPHCDYANGSIDLFTKKSPSAEVERVLVLELTKAVKQRSPVQGLGQRAFFTVIYPDDKYRRRGFLAIPLGSRILTLSMDPPYNSESPEATRPKLEGLAKLVLPRVK